MGIVLRSLTAGSACGTLKLPAGDDRVGVFAKSKYLRGPPESGAIPNRKLFPPQTFWADIPGSASRDIDLSSEPITRHWANPVCGSARNPRANGSLDFVSPP